MDPKGARNSGGTVTKKACPVCGKRYAPRTSSKRKQITCSAACLGEYKQNASAVAVGRRFGLWTVRKKVPYAPYMRSRYVCVCRCGLQSSISVGRLVQGLSRGCRSCASAQHGKARRTRVRGFRFRSLVVLTRSRDGRRYRLRCDCGKTVTRSVDTLYSSHGSCGCKARSAALERKRAASVKYASMVGTKHGALTLAACVRVPTPNTREGVWGFRAHCACGKSLVVRATDVRAGRSQSCGCQRANGVRAAYAKLKRKVDVFGVQMDFDTIAAMLGVSRTMVDTRVRKHGGDMAEILRAPRLDGPYSARRRERLARFVQLPGS